MSSLAKRLMKANPKLKKLLKQPSLATLVGQMLIEARTQKGITQGKLAKKMETSQSSIARAESGRHLPNLSFLDDMAKAYRTKLVPPRFAFLAEDWQEQVFSFIPENFAGEQSFAQRYVAKCYDGKPDNSEGARLAEEVVYEGADDTSMCMVFDPNVKEMWSGINTAIALRSQQIIKTR